MSIPSGTIKHFGYIDEVRGIAFLWVLSLHCAVCVGQFPLRWLFMQGIFGVDLFFLASAITLKASWAARSRVDCSPALAFYVRRLLRIAPMFWLGTIFYALLPDSIPRFWLSQFAPNGVRPIYYLLTSLFINGWYPYSFNCVVPGGWSIAVEMTFYAFCPLLFTFLVTPRRMAVSVLLCFWLTHFLCAPVPQFLRGHFFPMVLDDHAFSFWERFWFPSQAGVFMLGCCIYYLVNHPQVMRLMTERFWACSVLAISILALCGFLPGQTYFTPVDIWVVLALGGAIIALSRGAAPIPLRRLLRYIGTLSYSCYIVHFAVLGAILRFLHIMLSAEIPFRDFGSRAMNLLYFSALFALTLAATIVVSAGTNILVEKPGINLGRKIVRKMNLKYPTIAATISENKPC